jgi:hypothetical protein
MSIDYVETTVDPKSATLEQHFEGTLPVTARSSSAPNQSNLYLSA